MAEKDDGVISMVMDHRAADDDVGQLTYRHRGQFSLQVLSPAPARIVPSPERTMGVLSNDAGGSRKIIAAGRIPPYAAEAAAKRISGVAGIGNDIEVRLPSISERSAQPFSAAENIQVIVRKVWLNLEGHVEWHFQKTMAEEAVGGGLPA